MLTVYQARVRHKPEADITEFYFREFVPEGDDAFVITCRDEPAVIQAALQRYLDNVEEAPEPMASTDEFCIPVMVNVTRRVPFHAAEQLQVINGHIIIRDHDIQVVTESGLEIAQDIDSRANFSRVAEVVACDPESPFKPGDWLIYSINAIHHPRGRGKTPMMTVHGDRLWGIHLDDVVAKVNPVDQTAKNLTS